MERTRTWKRWSLIAAAVAIGATGGIAYASIPDAGGVIHTCYTKSSGAWRVIDQDAGQACTSRQVALDVYSKNGADLSFLGKTQKAADSNLLDGRDSADFLGATATAADSDKLDGLDSFHYLKAWDARILTDMTRLANGASRTLGHQAMGSYPGMLFDVACDARGGTTLVVRSSARFAWWWDGTFGQTGNTPPYEHTFPIGNGVGRHTFRGVHTIAWYTTTLDLDTSIGFDPVVESETCVLGWTLQKTLNDSPGP